MNGCRMVSIPYFSVRCDSITANKNMYFNFDRSAGLIFLRVNNKKPEAIQLMLIILKLHNKNDTVCIRKFGKYIIYFEVIAKCI